MRGSPPSWARWPSPTLSRARSGPRVRVTRRPRRNPGACTSCHCWAHRVRPRAGTGQRSASLALSPPRRLLGIATGILLTGGPRGMLGRGGAGMDKILQSMGRGNAVTVTNDGATILKSVYVDNPAAKVLVDISKVRRCCGRRARARAPGLLPGPLTVGARCGGCRDLRRRSCRCRTMRWAMAPHPWSCWRASCCARRRS
eukprot:scaffold1328_cov394-Prasinococcus_capsulatus_cf.AAC.49